MGGVTISPNIKKESVRIDPAGNVINPRTKQIIKLVEPEYVPPVVSQETPIPSDQGLRDRLAVSVLSSPLSIQQQIDEAKANLVKLEELKKLKIAEMKAQLELLES